MQEIIRLVSIDYRCNVKLINESLLKEEKRRKEK